MLELERQGTWKEKEKEKEKEKKGIGDGRRETRMYGNDKASNDRVQT